MSTRDLPPSLPATLLLATLLASGPRVAAAQEGEPPPPGEGADPVIVVDQSARSRVRLAFPAGDYAPGLGGDTLQAAREVERTLRDDLADTRIFQLQGPAELSVLTLTGVRSHDFEQLRSLGNEVVLFVTLKPDGDKLILEGRLYDLPSAQSIAGKRYRGLPSQARRIAHTFADEVHRLFTGRPGIALTSIAFHSDRNGHQELYLMDYDGHNQRRISGHRSTSGFPDWSPRGDAIAYMTYFPGTPSIYYVDVATNRKERVYGEGTLNISPSFSPDGERIAFAHSTSADVDVYVCERVCRNPRRITDSRGIDTNPVWGPAGRQIAFTSDRSGRPHLYVMDADGSNVRRVSFEGDYNDGATWRPDGTQLAYASRHDNRFQIAVTDLATLTTRLLTRGPSSHEDPTFSPDGRRLAFTLKRVAPTGIRESQIYVMDADGSNLKQLTQEGDSFAPDWSPYPAD